jgi:hypothetical protein
VGGRWLRVILGPLPATMLLMPLLFAGGLGAAAGLVAVMVQPGPSLAERWSNLLTPMTMLAWIAAAAAGVLALWLVVLAGTPADVRQSPLRWWVAGGLAVGVFAAARWLWLMAAGTHAYGGATWGLWIVLLVGPLVLGGYYLLQLVRGESDRDA